MSTRRKSALRCCGESSAGPKTHETEGTPCCSKPSRRPQSSVIRTPRCKKPESQGPLETPYLLRTKIKQRLNKMISDDAEYEIEDSISSEGSNESEPEDISEPKNSAASPKTKSTKQPVHALQTRAEDYFRACEMGVRTSNHTLSRLEMPQFDRVTLHKALQKIPGTHKTQRQSLIADHTKKFPKWLFQMSQGYNLLLYGLGSKISLLQEFRTMLIEDYTVLVVNGFFPSITIKHILNSITEEVLEYDGDFQKPEDQVTFIHKSLKESEHGKLVVIINSIDGVMLRSEHIQSTLCYLAQSALIHIVASTDHINAPLLWDQSKMSGFNWIWCDVTTFLPYTEETSYENSLLVQQTGSLALSSLHHVFHSLTPNAKGIFLLLARYQLDRKDKGSKYAGMSFQDCYQQCREAFFVNSELTLKAQLTEFKDHMLLKMKKGVDGSDNLHIPLDDVTISEFLQQCENS